MPRACVVMVLLAASVVSSAQRAGAEDFELVLPPAPGRLFMEAWQRDDGSWRLVSSEFGGPGPGRVLRLLDLAADGSAGQWSGWLPEDWPKVSWVERSPDGELVVLGDISEQTWQLRTRPLTRLDGELLPAWSLALTQPVDGPNAAFFAAGTDGAVYFHDDQTLVRLGPGGVEWSRDPDLAGSSLTALSDGGVAAWSRGETRWTVLRYSPDGEPGDSWFFEEPELPTCPWWNPSRFQASTLVECANGDLLVGLTAYSCRDLASPAHRVARLGSGPGERWSHELPGPRGGEVRLVSELADGRILVAWRSRGVSGGEGPEWHLRGLAPDGTALWDRRLGFAVDHVAPAAEGGFLLVGHELDEEESLVVLRHEGTGPLGQRLCVELDEAPVEAGLGPHAAVAGAPPEDRDLYRHLSVESRTESRVFELLGPLAERACDSRWTDFEDCDNGRDDDGDGALDCEDPFCVSDRACADADGDGHVAHLDCRDWDPTAWWLPAEVERLDVTRAAGFTSILSWPLEAEPSSDATTATVLGGDLALSWGAECFGPLAEVLASGLSGSSWTDGSGLASTGRWYLVRRDNACGEGPERAPDVQSCR